MLNKGEACVLEERLCIQCGECDMCELNAQKICDNCCQCIENDNDYAEIVIDDILLNEEDLSEHESEKTPEDKYKH